MVFIEGAQGAHTLRADAHLQRANLRLSLGYWDGAFDDLRWRWRSQPQRLFTKPLWCGAEIYGKTLLVCVNDGLGDTLNFCRYVKVVAQAGARVIVDVQPQLLRLLQGLEGASQVVATGDPLPHFDSHIGFVDLAGALKARVETIAPPARLRVDPLKVAYWRAKLGERIRPRIGLA